MERTITVPIHRVLNRHDFGSCNPIKRQLIIASAGSKKKMISGGAWVIVNEQGIPFVEGISLDFVFEQ